MRDWQLGRKIDPPSPSGYGGQVNDYLRMGDVEKDNEKLLPKLMKGEIRVKEPAIFAGRNK